MYRQVVLQEEDRKYHLIWWRNDPQQELKCYQLRTVTYGTSSAPYLATKCLQRLAQRELTKYPVGAQVLLRDFYVDDVMTGADSLAMAQDMQMQLTGILKEAGFKLRKWCANHSQLLHGIPPADQEVKLDFSDEKTSCIKTLGLIWLPKTDQFQTKLTVNEGLKSTKRTVASEIARIFDPLGIMAPVVIRAKIFLQELWELKLHWDASLTEELYTKWMNFRTNLSALNEIRIPRHMFAGNTPRVIQIHAFSDASEKAYGTVIYIRSINNEGRVIVRLLCAKSRVAPKKKLTVPGLELCAAKLGAELLQRVKTSSKLEQTFVGNRIASIQTLSLPQQWRHVKSEENPADVLSRGLSPEKLKSCNLWFYGPLFLHGSEDIWPPPYTKISDCDLERKRAALAVTATKIEDKSTHFINNIDHRNSFERLKRITGYVLRFVSRCRQKHAIFSPMLTAIELDEALFNIIKLMQQEEFQEDIRHLLRYKEVSKQSPLATLAPFLDERGIVRVGGRLQDSGLTYDSKHPMLLPHSHELTKLIMSESHKRNYHIGPQGLLSAIRQRFWPLKGKGIARSIVQHCIQCNKNKPKLMTQMMGNLPAARVQPARPFINSGVDFCGPIWIHYKIRGKRPQKAYVAIFCCFATKAVHLEVVSDLTTEAFIGSLTRFIGRRGHCRNLYCDNATNFVGARNQLARLSEAIHSDQGQQKITTMCSQKGIDFHFIPPRSPHFGGLWEAAVKSAKHLLVGTISSSSLTYEELETALVDVEAILNSRPLAPLSSDPNDLSALTPGHLLIGGPLTAPIDSQAKPIKTKLLRRWELVYDIKQQFWKRWSSEYLNELQYRFKWKQQSPNAKPGMLVILKEDNTPVQQWPLGRIVEVHKGKDGYVRVADVRTSTGVLRRPIHKLAPLPMEEGPDKERASEEDCTASNDETLRSGSNKRQNEDQASSKPSPTIATKRTKTPLGTSLLTLLLTVFIVPCAKGDLIEITQFEPQLGIHFEDLGATNLITSDWKIIVHYNLQPYWMELDILESGTKALQILCDQLTPKSACRQIISQFENLQNEIKIGNELLSPYSSSNRQKRGALNIIGNVANVLFGVLDQQYVEEMSKTIQSINENEDHLLTLLRNQTSVVDSTINLIRKDQAAIKLKFDSLDNYILQITNRLNEQGDTVRVRQQFMSLALQMSLVTTNLQHIQALITDVITDTNHGKINPLLVTPSQLRQAAAVIRNNLLSTLKLPIHQENILELYKLMNIKGGITQDHVIFQIKIPLVNWETFNLLKVYPIPAWINNSFVTVQTHSPFLMTSQHRDRFYPITELELTTCTTIEGKVHLCNQLHPIYHQGATMCACEIDFLNNNPRSEHCKLTQTLEQPIWLQLSDANQWMFATSNNTPINIVCDNQMFSKILRGTGLLKIQPQCTIKEKLITIHGHHQSTTNVKSSYTILGLSVEHLNTTKSPTHAEYDRKYQPQLKELLELHERVTSLNLDSLPKRIQENTIHQISISYIALFAVLLIVIYLVWKCRAEACKCCMKNPRPIPQPRQHINQINHI